MAIVELRVITKRHFDAGLEFMGEQWVRPHLIGKYRLVPDRTSGDTGGCTAMRGIHDG